MLRTALATVCAVLVIAVAALGIGNWRMSRTIDDLQGTLAAINENQKRITDAQESILAAQQANRPLTIQGRLYNRDPSKPASGAEVHLYRVSDRKLIDKYTTTPDGRFATAPQAPDRYFLVAPLVGANPTITRFESTTQSRFSSTSAANRRLDSGPAFAVQTPPILLSRHNNSPQVELDVQMIPIGQVSFDLSANMPSVTVHVRGRGGRGGLREPKRAPILKLQERGINLPDTLRSRLQIVMLKSGPVLPVLATRRPELVDWPLTRGLYHGDLADTYGWYSERWSREGRERERELSEQLANRNKSKSATSLDLLLYRRFEGSVPRFDVCESGSYQLGAYLRLAAYDRNVERTPIGGRSASPGGFTRPVERGAKTNYANWLPGDQLKTIEVQDGKRTHFRLTSSVDIEADTFAALESATTQEEFDALFERTWPVAIENLGFEEMILPNTER
jgi:hypothetical protein